MKRVGALEIAVMISTQLVHVRITVCYKAIVNPRNTHSCLSLFLVGTLACSGFGIDSTQLGGVVYEHPTQH